MSRFNIPKRFHNGFKYYFSLSRDIKDNFFKYIENAPVGMDPVDLASDIITKVNIEKAGAEAVIETIYSLFTLKEQTGSLDIKVFVSDIIDALKESKINPSPDFEGDLIKILSIKSSIALTNKAQDLVLDRQNILSSSRILTDIRPVFDVENEDNIKAVVIIHNLRIEYVDGFERKKAYFALNEEDLKKLKKDLMRAEIKEKAIKEKFNASISFLDIK